MKASTIILFSFLFAVNQLFAQNLSLLNDNCFGGSGTDNIYGKISLSNGSYLVYGYSDSPISGDKTEASFGGRDGWVVLFDSSGNELWQKTIGGNMDDYFFSGILLSTGDIMLSGFSESTSGGNKTSPSYGQSDVWLVKLDSNGNLLWDKSFGGSTRDSGSDLLEYSPGNILLLCSSDSGIEGNKTSPNKGLNDAWMIKVDINGNVLQQTTIGGNDEDTDATMQMISPNKILLSLVSRSNISGDKTENSYGGDNIWAVMIDTNIVLLDQKTIGGDQGEIASTILQLSSGNIVLVGVSSSNSFGLKSEDSYGGLDTWLIELNANLDLVREKTIGSNSDEYCRSSFVNANDQLVVLCSSDSDINQFKTQNNLGWRDIWVYMLDNDWNVIFDKTIGSAGNDAGVDISIDANSTIRILANSMGSISFDKTCAGNGQNDFWTLNLNSDLTVKENDLSKPLIYPNPATDYIQVDLEISNWDIYTINGEILKSGSGNKIDVSSLAEGIYYIKTENSIFLKFTKID